MEEWSVDQLEASLAEQEALAAQLEQQIENESVQAHEIETRGTKVKSSERVSNEEELLAARKRIEAIREQRKQRMEFEKQIKREVDQEMKADKERRMQSKASKEAEQIEKIKEEKRQRMLAKQAEKQAANEERKKRLAEKKKLKGLTDDEIYA